MKRIVVGERFDLWTKKEAEERQNAGGMDGRLDFFPSFSTPISCLLKKLLLLPLVLVLLLCVVVFVVVGGGFTRTTVYSLSWNRKSAPTQYKPVPTKSNSN